MLEVPYDLFSLWFRRVGYTPSPEQERIHRALCEPTVGVELPTLLIEGGGEQAGKSWSAGHHIYARAIFDEVLWIIGDRYEDCRKEFEAARDAAIAAGMTKPGMYSTGKDGPWELRYTYRMTEDGQIVTPGCVVKTLSSDDVTRLFGEAPSGAVMCEPGRQTYDAFHALWRRVGQVKGWMLVAGTFEGSTGRARWYPDLWRECQGDNAFHGRSLSLPTYANRERFPLGEHDPKFRALCKAIREENPAEGEEIIAERFLGIPRIPKGLVFSEFRRQIHVKDYATFLPEHETHLWVDPGYFPSAYAVIWVQVVGGQIRVCDEIYTHHLTNDEVIDLVENHEWFGSVTYVVPDVAARQHAGAQGSALETWRARMAKHTVAGKRNIMVSSGTKVAIAERNSRIHDKLRVNPITGQPWLVVSPIAKNTVQEFEEGYRLRERRSGDIHSDNPIDESNHAIAAIGYGIIDRWGLTDVRRELPSFPRQTMGYDRLRPARSGFGAGRGTRR